MPKQQVALWDLLTLFAAATPIGGAIAAAQGRSHTLLLLSIAIGFCVGVASFVGIRLTLTRLAVYLVRDKQLPIARRTERLLILLYLSMVIWVVVADIAGFYAVMLLIGRR